ncbi:MAG: hypothetical protein HC893_16340 [Chloroflexaceae bacterium]|nr:hypothetical protein [Chloroflexaceae bacterium]
MLGTNERILFSRYLSSGSWRPVRLRPRTGLRVLVLVANPRNLADYTPGGRRLAPVDIDAELLRARIGMEGMQITPITEQGTVTINNLVQHLRDGYDMLYLVAHGALVSGEPRCGWKTAMDWQMWFRATNWLSGSTNCPPCRVWWC